MQTAEQAYQQELEHRESLEMSKKSFAREVWESLSAVNVNNFTEKKGKLTYLSWAHAWTCLMELYPESNYERLEDEIFQDGTMSVNMRITVREGENELVRDMYLQVLDNRNQPLERPNSHEINNTRMRCLTKAIAMCGLGCYVYAGADLPMDEETQVVVKKPRIPHDEMLAKMKDIYDQVTDRATLEMHFANNWKYFGEKEWNSKPHQEALKEHYDKIKATLPEKNKAA